MSNKYLEKIAEKKDGKEKRSPSVFWGGVKGAAGGALVGAWKGESDAKEVIRSNKYKKVSRGVDKGVKEAIKGNYVPLNPKARKEAVSKLTQKGYRKGMGKGALIGAAAGASLHGIAKVMEKRDSKK